MRKSVSLLAGLLACQGAAWADGVPAAAPVQAPVVYAGSTVRLPGAADLRAPVLEAPAPGPAPLGLAGQLGRMVAANLAQHYGMGGKVANLDRPAARCQLDPGAPPCLDGAGLAEDGSASVAGH